MPIWVLLALACSPSPTVELDDDVRTAAIVRWRSNEPGVGSVRYGPEGGSLDQETPEEATPTLEHEVRVAGLRPGETWAFEATVNGLPASLFVFLKSVHIETAKSKSMPWP